MTLVIENASENLANAIKGIVKLEKGARYRKASQEPSDELSNKMQAVFMLSFTKNLFI